MSDTPRTDAAWSSGFDPVILSAAELARRLREQCADLERENAALRSLVQHWYKLVPENIRSSIEDAQKETQP